MSKTKISVLFFLLVSFMSLGCQKIMDTKKAVELNDEGVSMLNAWEHEGAIEKFRKALEYPQVDNDLRAQIMRNLSLAFDMEDESDSAMKYCLGAANLLDSTSYLHIVSMADYDVLSGNIESAANRLEQAVVMNPEDMMAYNSLGLIYLGEYGDEYMDIKKALKYNQKAYDLQEDRATKEVLAQTFWMDEQYDKAYDLYLGLIEANPEIADYQLNAGMILWDKEDQEGAQPYFDKAIELDPELKGIVQIYQGQLNMDDESEELTEIELQESEND